MKSQSCLPAWETVEAQLKELVDAPVTEETLEPWLEKWSNIACEMNDAWLLLLQVKALDTSNDKASQELELLTGELNPKFNKYEETLRQKAQGFQGRTKNSKLILADLAKVTASYSGANSILWDEESTLQSSYETLRSRLRVKDGVEELTVQMAQGRLLATRDRGERYTLWQNINAAFEPEQDWIGDHYLQLCRLRQKIATNVGMTYRDYQWHDLYRTGYTPDDTAKLLDWIAEAFEPLINEKTNREAKLLGLEKLKPWDVDLTLGEGMENRVLTEVEMVSAAKEALAQLDPSFADHVDKLQQRGAIDLMSRANKSPFNMATGLSANGLSYVRCNLTGHPMDLLMVLHEIGHTIHFSYTLPNKPFWLKFPPSEVTEFVAFFFQFAGGRHLGGTGMFTKNETEMFLQHLYDEVINSLVRVTNSERFQHRVFQAEVNNLAAGDLSDFYQNSVVTAKVDWTNHEKTLRTLWQRRPHIFTYPFKDSAYAIAWIGVLLFLESYHRDPKGSFQNLRHMMSLGNTATISESYQVLGLEFPFTKQTVHQARDTLHTQFGTP